MRDIAAQINEAIKRTGYTTALQKACERIPAILKMTPAQFEEFSKKYHS